MYSLCSYSSINLLNAKQIEIIDSDIRIHNVDEIVISPSKLIDRIFPDSDALTLCDILRDE